MSIGIKFWRAIFRVDPIELTFLRNVHSVPTCRSDANGRCDGEWPSWKF